MSVLDIKMAFALCMALAEPQRSLASEGKSIACESASHIIRHSVDADFDPALVAALITVESSWRPEIVSTAGACGLTQVMPRWTGKMTAGRRYTCEELRHPSNSVAAGVAALGYWRKRHRKNVRLALCGYNAGNSCSAESTQLHAGIRYSDKVMRLSLSISSSMEKYMKLMDFPRRALALLLGRTEQLRYESRLAWKSSNN